MDHIFLPAAQENAYRTSGLPSHPLLRRAFQLRMAIETMHEDEEPSEEDLASLEQDGRTREEAVLAFKEGALDEHYYREEMEQAAEKAGVMYRELLAIVPNPSPEMIAVYTLRPLTQFLDYKIDKEKLEIILNQFSTLNERVTVLMGDLSNPTDRWEDLDPESVELRTVTLITTAERFLDIFSYNYYTNTAGTSLKWLEDAGDMINMLEDHTHFLSDAVHKRAAIMKGRYQATERYFQLHPPIMLAQDGQVCVFPHNFIELAQMPMSERFVLAETPIWAQAGPKPAL